MAQKGFFHFVFGIIVAATALWLLFVVMPAIAPLGSASLLAQLSRVAFSQPGGLEGRVGHPRGGQLLLFDEDQMSLLHSLQLNGREYSMTVPSGAYWVTLDPLPPSAAGKLPGFIVISPGRTTVLDL